jgi:tripartite-type tricarboxylate transporter receptor subunit TctC
LAKGGQIMIVNPKVEAKSVAEFIALAKKQPGKLTFGSGSSSSRIAGELLQQMAGIQILHVPLQEQPSRHHRPPRGPDRHDGHRHATGIPQVQAGKVRALGVTASKRIPLAPDVPTIDEAGVKGYEMGLLVRAYVPAKTPPRGRPEASYRIDRGDQGAAAVKFYESTGVDPVVSTPEELAKFQGAESQKWGDRSSRRPTSAGVTLAARDDRLRHDPQARHRVGHHQDEHRPLAAHAALRVGNSRRESECAR